MQWWNDFVEWFFSDAGWRIVSTAILPFLAIFVAALVAAAIARGSVRRLIWQHDRESSASAVSSVINVARRSAVWNNISGPEQDHLAYQSSEATTRLRLLPVTGASLAADWSEHQITDIKRNSTGFSVQAEQSSIDVRDRLIEWHHKPSRAKKLFAADVDHFRYEDKTVDKDLIEKQRQWAERQATARPAAEPSGSPATPSFRAEAPSAPAEPATPPEAPRVPSAASRAFTPSVAQTTAKEPSPTTDQTDVVHATIDEEPTPSPRSARGSADQD